MLNVWGISYLTPVKTKRRIPIGMPSKPFTVLFIWNDRLHFAGLLQHVNPLAGISTFLSPTVHGRSDNIVVFP